MATEAQNTTALAGPERRNYANVCRVPTKKTATAGHVAKPAPAAADTTGRAAMPEYPKPPTHPRVVIMAGNTRHGAPVSGDAIATARAAARRR